MSCKREDSLLVRIAGRYYHKKWFFSGETGNEVTTVPFELVDGWIVVKVKLNDQENTEYRFIFDSGAISSIEPEIAKVLNLAPLRNFASTDVNDVRSSVSLVNLRKLTIGKRSFSKVGALSSHHALTSCNGIDGVVGYNILGKGVFKVNYKTQTITISSEENFFNKKDFHSVRMIKDWRRMLYLKLTTNNKSFNALLDTGAPDYVFLNNSLQKEFCEDYLLQRRLKYLNGANSSILDTLSIYKGHNLKLSELSIDRDVLIFSNIDNSIGNGFLAGFEEVVINVKKNRLYLSKKELERKKRNSLINLNIGWKEGLVKITGLAIESKIAKIGLKIGDQVTSINDVQVSSFQDNCEFSLFKSSLEFANTDLRLSILRDGRSYNYVISKSMMYE